MIKYRVLSSLKYVDSLDSIKTDYPELKSILVEHLKDYESDSRVVGAFNSSNKLVGAILVSDFDNYSFGESKYNSQSVVNLIIDSIIVDKSELSKKVGTGLLKYCSSLIIKDNQTSNQVYLFADVYSESSGFYVRNLFKRAGLKDKSLMVKKIK